jgi:hypothetical protein
MPVSVCGIFANLHQLTIELSVARVNFVPVVAKGPSPTVDSYKVPAAKVYLLARTLATQGMMDRMKAMGFS